MGIVYSDEELASYMEQATRVTPDHPVYLDAFLEDAVELDVDALSDGSRVYVGAILEHIEECGIHSGDSACCFPPFSLSSRIVSDVRETTRRLALACGIRGLLNVQYAIKDGQVYVIELNPRASRTVPFDSKASGVPLAKNAALIMAGRTLDELDLPPEDRAFGYFAVKEAVMPWARFSGADTTLGPEMKSTGEVMGLDRTFPLAYAKTREAIDYHIPTEGTVFVSVNDRDKRSIGPVALALSNLGYDIVATEGTARVLAAAGIPCERINTVSEPHPNVGDAIRQGRIAFMINTPHGHRSRGDGFRIRTMAVNHGIDLVTAMSGATALIQAIAALRTNPLEPYALQDLMDSGGRLEKAAKRD
jgi:carbamoyl-phosphate synthase large subunit